MRKIKFRAWDEDEMVEVTQLNLETTEHTVFDGIHEYICNINEKDVMQYTGLKDVNGIKIYEGDIVESMSEGLKGIFEIRWRQDGSPCWILYPAWQGNEMWHIVSQKHSDGNYYDKLKVIGNIYEKPELLESKS